MAKQAVFTMKLEPELRDAFMAAAAKADRPASQVVREMMRDYVQQDRAYVEWLQRKVDESRRAYVEGLWHTNEDVEVEFSKKREELRRRAAEKRD